MCFSFVGHEAGRVIDARSPETANPRWIVAACPFAGARSTSAGV